MNYCKILVLFAISLPLSLKSQIKPDVRIFQGLTIYWCGLDFSEAKMIGAVGFPDPEAIVSEYFGKWNALVLDEDKKYNVREPYLKMTQINMLTIATERNAHVDPKTLVSETANIIADSTMINIVKGYKFEDVSTGLGLVYVVENFNKLAETGSIFAVFFDLSNQEILWKVRIVSTPQGNGFRNYWSGVISKTRIHSGEKYRDYRMNKPY